MVPDTAEFGVTDVMAETGANARAARSYAEALHAAAVKTGAEEAVEADLAALSVDVFREQPEAVALLGSRAISAPEKDALIDRVFAAATPVFLDFLHVLNAHDRLDLLRGVAAAFRDLRDERAERTRVQVRAAVALSDAQQAKLKEALAQKIGRAPVLEVAVDPALLGGMVVQIGDQVFDYSVRTRLGNVRSHLMTRSSHVIQSQRDRLGTAG